MFNCNYFEKALERKLNKITINKILFLCIGTSENLADSIGPLIGSKLKNELGEAMVLGDIKNNIKNKYDLIYNLYKMKNKKIIAIDSAISEGNLPEEIFVNNGPLIMGLALGSNKGIIGDINIKIAIKSLNLEDKYYINNYAKSVSNSIIKVVKSYI